MASTIIVNWDVLISGGHREFCPTINLTTDFKIDYCSHCLYDEFINEMYSC
jgi:hypothetical protein